jgi:hypothetical protein
MASQRKWKTRFSLFCAGGDERLHAFAETSTFSHGRIESENRGAFFTHCQVSHPKRQIDDFLAGKYFYRPQVNNEPLPLCPWMFKCWMEDLLFQKIAMSIHQNINNIKSFLKNLISLTAKMISLSKNTSP